MVLVDDAAESVVWGLSRPVQDAFARYNGTAPLPIRSGNRQRFRLPGISNRQLNTALHHIAITRAHYHERPAPTSNDY